MADVEPMVRGGVVMKTNWGPVIVDSLTIILAVGAALYTGNPSWLWLLVILVFTGSYRFEEGL